MKRYEAKIRQDVQKVLDSNGLQHFHIECTTHGSFMLARKCGHVTYIPVAQLGDATARDDVPGITELLSDWITEAYPTIVKLELAEADLKEYNKIKRPSEVLPKSIAVWSYSNQSMGIRYDNYKLPGNFRWELNLDGSIIDMTYGAAPKKKRCTFATAIKHRPEKAHIKICIEDRKWYSGLSKRTRAIDRYTETLSTCQP